MQFVETWNSIGMTELTLSSSENCLVIKIVEFMKLMKPSKILSDGVCGFTKKVGTCLLWNNGFCTNTKFRISLACKKMNLLCLGGHRVSEFVHLWTLWCLLVSLGSPSFILQFELTIYNLYKPAGHASRCFGTHPARSWESYSVLATLMTMGSIF